jgi:hypothetical protein
MAGRTLVQEAAVELTGKAVMWGPAIAGAILLGPAGVVLGLATSVAIATRLSSSSPPCVDNDRSSGREGRA